MNAEQRDELLREKELLEELLETSTSDMERQALKRELEKVELRLESA